MTSYKAIEWPVVLRHLSQLAQTKLGQNSCLNLDLSSNLAKINTKLLTLGDAYNLILRKEDINLSQLPDIANLLDLIKPGFVFNVNEIMDILKTLQTVQEIKPKLTTEINKDKATSNLRNLTETLVIMPDLISSIEAVFDENGQFKNDCSANHYQLMMALQKQEDNLKEELNNIIHHPKLSLALMEPIYTKRNDRFVIPVKVSHKNDIKGIIHDRSTSGLTYYIEPFTIVNLSNKIQNIKNEIDQEKNRILKHLSKLIINEIEGFRTNYYNLIELDIVFAKARFAYLYDGTKPILTDNKKCNLKNLKHPLLILKNTSVIGSDIDFDELNNSLIITGPNAGGKTILLKSIGLACLMAKAGMFIAAQANSVINIYNDIYLSIGDNQSVEANLSTFSSHLKNIIAIIKEASQYSLILIDEIATGTNPQEGVALAKAIIEALHKKNSTNVFTTHYEELITLKQKYTGINYGGFEYDNNLMQSTYKFKLNLTSGSHAFDLAKKLDLPSEILDNAYKIYKEDFHISYSLHMLKVKETELNSKEAELNNRLEKIVESENKIKEFYQTNQANLSKEFDNLKNQLQTEYKNSIDEINKIIKDLQSNKNQNLANLTKQKAKSIVESFDKKMTPENNVTDLSKLKIGSYVKVKSLNLSGEVIKINNTNSDKTEIIVKSAKFNVKAGLNDIEIISKLPKIKTKKIQLPHTANSINTENIFGSFNTVNIIGKRVNEAIPIVEEFIDRCYFNNLSSLLVIHGMGQGILKNAVHEYLNTSTYVADYKPGDNDIGGHGVTVVNLKG